MVSVMVVVVVLVMVVMMNSIAQTSASDLLHY